MSGWSIPDMRAPVGQRFAASRTRIRGLHLSGREVPGHSRDGGMPAC